MKMAFKRFSVLTSIDPGLNEKLEEGIVEDIGDDGYEVASEKGDTATFMADTTENLTLENMNTQIPKQREIQEVVRSNNLSICAVLESHVLAPKLKKVCNDVFGNWKWMSNSRKCDRDTRIILGWDPNKVNVMLLEQSGQALHCQVTILNDKTHFFCSFIYAANRHIQKRELWSELGLHNRVVAGRPWVLLGDFNVALNIEDNSSGTSGITCGMGDFKDCMEEIEVSDLNQICTILGNLFDKMVKLREKLDEIQTALDKDPTNTELRVEESHYLKAFNDAVLDEERFLKQKSKIKWLREGDGNTSYFHKVVKGRNHSNRIEAIRDTSGNYFEGEDVATQFVNHFHQFLGDSMEDEEIKRAMFSIDNDSAPGPDVYSSKFFKASWFIVGPDVCKVVKDFLGELLGVLSRSIFKKRKRGLRQGDPMSPYLFTIVMEVLNLIIKRRIDEEGDFQYHPKCQSQKITHLCFADDLILFCHGDILSASLIKEALDKFKEYSGLVPSIQKSIAFFSNVKQTIKNSILAIMPFEEGSLPVKYLGVPLISSRLLYKDCKVLVEKCNINDAGFNLTMSVNEVIEDMRWLWPQEWMTNHSLLNQIEVPVLNESVEDKVYWVDKHGHTIPFSVGGVWNDI
ncbi:putative reverse transcriptase domain-containing protein [Tanacetum coccineum]